MAMIATDIKGMLSVKIKPRNDTYTDQYNRIFMVKILLVTCVIMGISWFNDSVKCLVPGVNAVDGGFVSQACWIQGVYVYKELMYRSSEVGYFGIPKDMDNDGMLASGELCSTTPKFGVVNEKCKPMQKTFFLQYQWMPFLIAALSILYYLPYIGFRSANSDLISLKNTIKGGTANAEKIAKNFFDRHSNPSRNMTLRVVFNILIKVLYIVANLVAFLGLDNLLNGEFVSYGSKWVSWAKLDNAVAYDYMGKYDQPKPGNVLLPPFGYCEMYESSKDIKHSTANKHKLICELSQNILYQYSLVIVWFAIVFGIVISVIGLILLLVSYAVNMFGAKDNYGGKKIRSLTLREREYLEFIQKKNPILYREVLECLHDGNDTLPLYPQADRYNEKGAGYQL